MRINLEDSKRVCLFARGRRFATDARKLQHCLLAVYTAYTCFLQRGVLELEWSLSLPLPISNCYFSWQRPGVVLRESAEHEVHEATQTSSRSTCNWHCAPIDLFEACEGPRRLCRALQTIRPRVDQLLHRRQRRVGNKVHQQRNQRFPVVRELSFSKLLYT